MGLNTVGMSISSEIGSWKILVPIPFQTQSIVFNNTNTETQILSTSNEYVPACKKAI